MSTIYKKSWLLCLSGATNAIARVDMALASKDVDAKVILPLIEALWWVCAADDTLSEEYGSAWERHLRAKLPELPLLLGLRWARNRATHQACHWELARPPFHWADATTVAPPGRVKPRHDKGRAEYVSHLEGRDALQALKAVVEGIKKAAIRGLAP